MPHHHVAAANVQGARDRSRIIAQSAEDTRRTIREGYENRQRSEDRNSERWSDAMRGVQNFRNPTTGENVKLSNQYTHAWVNGNGEYVMNDAPGFNPGQVLQGSWTELQPVRHRAAPASEWLRFRSNTLHMVVATTCSWPESPPPDGEVPAPFRRSAASPRGA